MENNDINLNEAEFDLMKEFMSKYQSDTEKFSSNFDKVKAEVDKMKAAGDGEKGGARWWPESCIIDWIADSEAQILFYMYLLFSFGFLGQIISLPCIEDKAEVSKDVLCSLACKELAIADVLNSLACKIAVNKGLIKSDCDCDCNF